MELFLVVSLRLWDLEFEVLIMSNGRRRERTR